VVEGYARVTENYVLMDNLLPWCSLIMECTEKSQNKRVPHGTLETITCLQPEESDTSPAYLNPEKVISFVGSQAGDARND